LARRAGRARIVMLHGVSGEARPRAAFEALLRWLARHFRVVPLAQIVDALLSDEGPVGDEVALTFDDGLRNNALVAAPLLARHGLPATFFVCPERIETGRWLWTHEMRARLDTLEPAGSRWMAESLIEVGIAEASPERFLRWMKTLHGRARRGIEEGVRAQTSSFVADAALAARYDVMSWAELEALDPALITVGSHTRTHPILPTLEDDALLTQEIAGSRAELEARLERPVDLFCYPDGAVDPRVHAVVAAHYRAAVTTEAATVPPDANAHLLPRVGAADRLAEFAWRMVRP